MTAGERLFRRHAARLVALAIIVGLYGLARAAASCRAPNRRGWRDDSASSASRCRNSPATSRGRSARSIPA